MRKRYRDGLLAAAVLGVSTSVSADAIELFAGIPSDGDAPSVVFVLDNAANFSANVASMRCSITAGGAVKTDGTGTAPTNLDGTAGAVEQCALYSAISALSANTAATINIGVMGFNANGMKQFNPTSNSFSASCVGGTGGCLLMPLTPFTPANKASILEWIRLWAVSGGTDYNMKGNNTANGAAMQETWAYFNGKTGVSGRNYSGMQPAGGCANKYTIFIGNAYRNNATPGDSTNEASSPLRPLNGTSLDSNKWADPPATAEQRAIITGTVATSCGTDTLRTDEGRGIYALNWARYMKSQGIITYSIGVLGPTCNSEYAAHLSRLGASDVGGGKYFPTNNFAELKAAIETALSEIQSVNSAFASVSLPASVNAQGTYLNQVYIGMFRPSENFLPRWDGNLKQYKAGRENGELKLLDADDQPAISGAGTGFFSGCARSFWTPTADDTYWTSFAGEEPNCVGRDVRSNTPDGNVVEKGAHGYMLRGSPTAASITRSVKTCDAACSGVLADFATGNSAITKAALGNAGMSDAERTALINWARGQNNAGDETFVASTAMRPSVHGDVVHSRPVAINFGTDQIPQVVVFYGGNDGVLRAINGNRDGGVSIGGAAPGREMWAFVAPEFYSSINRLRANATPVSFRGSSVATAKEKDYGFDGPITAQLNGNSAWIFAPMRRGGRAVYAFNFDPLTPANSTLMWKKGCPNNFPATGAVSDANCSAGAAVNGVSQDFSGIGQTWALPKLVKAAGYATGAAGTEKPILIMGGGYDTCEDYDVVSGGVAYNNNCTASSKGKQIYVLDAETGTVLKTLATDRGVVGDVAIIPDLSTRLAKYGYVADLGGNVYRINIGNAAPGAWTITKIASLGCDTVASCTANRKFLFAPDVVVEGDTNIVLLGSGDREKPLSAYTATTAVNNYFFMIKDKPGDPEWLASEAGNCSSNSVMCLDSLLAITDSDTPTEASLAEKKGWYLGLRSTEQIVTSAITISGVTTFSSHMPSVIADGVCVPNLGTASVYNIRYLNAASANDTVNRYEAIDGGGIPPSPVAGRITLDSGEVVRFRFGSTTSSAFEIEEPEDDPSGTAPLPRSRVYWHIQK